MTRRILRWGFLLSAVVIALFPIYWTLVTALKPQAEIVQSVPSFWPQDPSLDSFQRLFAKGEFGYYLRNSVLIVATAVALSLLLGSLAAYALARFRLPGRLNDQIGFAFLAVRVVPPIVIVVPLFVLIVRLGLQDSYPGLILVYAAMNVPLVVWVMTSFFQEIPRELEEAAMSDGASRMTALRTVVLPIAAPGLVATAILAAMFAYNDFLFAVVLTTTPDAGTVPVGAAALLGKSQPDTGVLAAAGIVGILPIVVFALVVQKHLVRGLTMGSFR